MPDRMARELQVGDDLKVLDPTNRGRVTAITQSRSPMMRYGAGPGEPMADALIIDFIYRDEPRAGERAYVFLHPETKVRLA